MDCVAVRAIEAIKAIEAIGKATCRSWFSQRALCRSKNPNTVDYVTVALKLRSYFSLMGALYRSKTSKTNNGNNGNNGNNAKKAKTSR